MAKCVVVHHEMGYVLAVVPSAHRIDITYEIKDEHTVIVRAPKMPDLPHTIFEHDGRTCFRFTDPSDPMRFCKTG